MMLQASYSERPRVSLPVKQERLAAAKVRHPRPPDCFWKMPIAVRTILLQLVDPMMTAYMLQICHGNDESAALIDRVNNVVQRSHFTPGNQTRRPTAPTLSAVPEPTR